MTQARVAIGTRGSRLAMIQAGYVVAAFERAGVRSHIVVIESDGDRRAPDTAWGEGAFVVAIERALLAGDIDVAVHSAKDVPVDEPEGLAIGAYLVRADPRDALVVRVGSAARCMADLPPGSRVGTDSPRRTAFIRAQRPDLDVHPLHGNVDTRLRRLDDGETDALVLACAGLDRLGFGDRIVERLDPAMVPPAPGQGAIAVQVRRDDTGLAGPLATMDDADTRAAVEAERAVLQACGGGCRSPIGVLASVAGDEATIVGGAASLDGVSVVMARRRGDRRAMAALTGAVASTLVGSHWGVDRERVAPASARVMVTRAYDQSAPLVAALRELGVEPVSVPTIAIELDRTHGELEVAARHLHTYDWTVVTSANGVRAILGAAERVWTPLDATRWAAVGPATADALERDGIDVDFMPDDHSARAMAASLPVANGQRVLVVRGDLAGEDLANGLRARGALVDDVVAYRTCEAPVDSEELLVGALDQGGIDAVVLTSGSTVRGLLTLARGAHVDTTGIPAVCIGPETAAVARAAGFDVVAVAATTEDRALAAATVGALLSQARDR